MADCQPGRAFLIPRARRLTWDLLAFNRAVPLCGHDRTMDLSQLKQARRLAPVRISWPAVFVKAYGLLAKEVPALRQIWYRWPIAHLYEHPHSVAAVAVQRVHEGTPWLFWGLIKRPEDMSLLQIQHRLDQLTEGDVVRTYRKQIQLASLPTLLRRIIWGWNLAVAKSRRAGRLGTFFLSTLSGKGVEIQTPPSIQTGCLTYGPLDRNSHCRVTLAYDHRVVDGALIADCLNRMEVILSETVRSELLNLSPAVHDTADVA